MSAPPLPPSSSVNWNYPIQYVSQAIPQQHHGTAKAVGIIFIILLIAGIIGFVIYLIVHNRNKKKEKPDVDPKTQPVEEGKSYFISDATSKMCLSFDVKTRHLVIKACDPKDPGQKFTAVRVTSGALEKERPSWWLRNTQEAEKIPGDNLPAGMKTFCMTLNTSPNRGENWNLGVECEPWVAKPDTHWMFGKIKDATGENWSMTTEQALTGMPNEKTDQPGPLNACLIYDATAKKLTFTGNCASQNWVFTPVP